MKDKSNQAFPGSYHGSQYYGMTLREWYAGMALQGMLAFHDGKATCQYKAVDDAAEAFRFADAMIGESEKERAE